MWKNFKELIHMLNLELLVMRGDKKTKANTLKNVIAQAFRVMKEDIDNHYLNYKKFVK